MKITLQIIGILLLLGIVYLGYYLIGLAKMGEINPPDERPYFITQTPMTVKNLHLPEGTKIIYGKAKFWKKKQQQKALNESHITELLFAEGASLDWAGVPITAFVKFANSTMSGYTLHANFDQLAPQKQTEFTRLWQSCNDRLGITVRNNEDWSFATDNILDVESCGVNYQRYFGEEIEQQQFLNRLREALLRLND